MLAHDEMTVTDGERLVESGAKPVAFFPDVDNPFSRREVGYTDYTALLRN